MERSDQCKGGDIGGNLWAGGDTIGLMGWVTRDGEVYLSGGGSFVGTEWEDKMVDWSKGIARGMMTANGEESCDGPFELKKIK